MRQEIADLKKQLILEEAAKHFGPKGYEATQVSQIAKDAEVSIGTIYGFFESKEGLFQSYILLKIDQATEALKTIIQNSELTPKENLKALLTYHFTEIEKTKSSVKEMMLSSPIVMGQFCHNACTSEHNPMLELHKITASQLKIMHKTHPFRSTDFLQHAFNLKGLAFSYIERWALLEDIELSDKIDECLDIFFRGVLS